ncbi:hypothetical protein Pcinc_034730 [Petrolisthes cinctipes]|uniref:Uncharacterized protein n=1 Tax=Petrolisthes cinctipes TaxID=88211 RepID=A0AAE1BY62_PETCI|nr:hypothetical protein Pcinc_034730 [Petrolisthes cinctipes]
MKTLDPCLTYWCEESIEEVHRAVAAGDGRAAMNMLDNRKKAMARDTNHSTWSTRHSFMAMMNWRSSWHDGTLSFCSRLTKKVEHHYTTLPSVSTPTTTPHLYTMTFKDLGAEKLATDTFGHTPRTTFTTPTL